MSPKHFQSYSIWKNLHFKSKITVTCIGADILFRGQKILESSEEPWQFMDVRGRQTRNVYFNTYAKNVS
jgi:hypothetical protein